MSRPADFWARRKAKVAEEQLAEARAAEAAEEAAREAELAEKSDEEILEDLGLPDPDSLEEGADFKAFMAKAVPDRIRRRALRRLWISNPALANLDGLLDYGEDFTDSAKVIENMQTAYQVGKGMLAHVEELARQAEAKEQAEAEVASADPEPSEPIVEPVAEDNTVALHDAEPAPRPAQTTDPAEAREDHDEPVDLQPRRRMRFSFDDQSERATG
jgi:hypothetical protein